MQAQFSALRSWPAKSASLRLRTLGADAALDDVTMLVSSSIRPKKAGKPIPVVQADGSPPIFALLGDAGELLLEPGFERHHQRPALVLAHAASVTGAHAPDRRLACIERSNVLASDALFGQIRRLRIEPPPLV